MEKEKDFLKDLVTTEKSTEVTQKEYKEHSSTEMVYVEESEDDYLLTDIEDDEQKNHIEKEEVEEVLKKSNCTINELFDILSVIYRAYVDYNDYLGLKGLYDENEFRKSVVDNEKIINVVTDLLSRYNPIEMFNALEQMNYIELVEFIFSNNIDAIESRFEQQDIGKRAFAIKMSAFRNEFND